MPEFSQAQVVADMVAGKIVTQEAHLEKTLVPPAGNEELLLVVEDPPGESP